MASFRYSAIRDDGERITGVMEGADRAAAIGKLGAQGLHPIDVTDSETESAGRVFRFGGGASHKEISVFTRELAWLLKAGMTLNKALDILAKEAFSPSFAAAVNGMRNGIRKGQSFRDTLAETGIFSPYYASMIEAGEASGTLPAVLESVAASRDREQKIRGRLASALMYPAMLVVLSIGAVVFIMTSIVPSIKEMITGTGAPMPENARTIIAASDWLIANGFTAIVSVLLAALLLALVAGGAGARRLLMAFAMRLPMIGALLRRSAVVQFCRVLGTLLAAGVSLPASLKLMRPSAGDPEIATALTEMEAALRRGEDFLAPLDRSRFFPKLLSRMLRVGNETGNLTPSVLQATAILEEELDGAIDRTLTLLGPAIILALSAAIAFIITSLMGAIISINDLAL